MKDEGLVGQQSIAGDEIEMLDLQSVVYEMLDLQSVVYKRLTGSSLNLWKKLSSSLSPNSTF